jgi:hypothetical protein
MRAPIQAEFDLTAEESDVEQGTSNNRKIIPSLPKSQKTTKTKRSRTPNAPILPR